MRAGCSYFYMDNLIESLVYPSSISTSESYSSACHIATTECTGLPELRHASSRSQQGVNGLPRIDLAASA